MLGSLTRCSINSMSCPFYLHPPSLPSSSALRDNSNYLTPASVPSVHHSSALFSSPCSMRAAFGTTPTSVRQVDARLCWISLGWVRHFLHSRSPVDLAAVLRHRYRIHTLAHATSPARSSHHHAFRRRHDHCVRGYVRAGGDEGGPPCYARSNTF
jgi:hypothetical protein